MRHDPRAMAAAGPRQHSRIAEAKIISAGEQRKAFRSAQRHSRYVTILKLGLPLIALGLISMFIYWVTSQKPAPVPENLSANEQTFKQDELIMQNPNLNGYADGRAYEVLAKTATQKPAEPDLVYLQSMQAQISQTNGEWVAFTSNTGIFNQATQWMEVAGSVDVLFSAGARLMTEKIQVETVKDYLQSLTPVAIEAEGIRLQAGKMEAFEGGDHLRFSQGVRFTFDRTLPGPSLDRTNQIGAQQ